ncbi:DapH/DapD/GlmU-related protein [Bacillus cereus]|uniref:Acetyltransferase n=1 Tax=Bacillus cereus TaxID=1396 RepID=A0AA44QBY7_BACCE|nr:DapH/DapD/GlmU-related protein [Bacillus cereus]PFN07052.1 acetyltransferase [Bacillus cereus]PFS02790.1 acetyltransferase [Bacillus cereus]PGZ12840.1 acetyltransferase [Bacillus cereus]
MLANLKSFIKWKLRGEVPTKQLVKMGLKVGKNFNRLNGCIIDYSHCWLITIGDNVTLAPRVHILAHDASTKLHLNYTKIGLVSIGNDVFVGAGTIILPNVKIGNSVIIGAGSVVTKDIPENSVAVGNPAKVIDKTNNYLNKNKVVMNSRPIFDESWTIRGNVNYTQKKEMIDSLKDGLGYVK